MPGDYSGDNAIQTQFKYRRNLLSAESILLGRYARVVSTAKHLMILILFADMGYKNIRVGARWTTEHRNKMEEHLQRKLLDTEVVHHINGDKKDNRIDNLQVMTRKEHDRLHSERNRVKRVKLLCSYCKTSVEKRPKQIQRNENVFCSKECSGNYYYEKKGIPTTRNDIDHLIIKGIQKNWSAYRIAKEYNLSRSTVWRHMKQLRQ